MDFIEFSKDRYSVRSFSKKQIEEEKLQKIIEAGNIAPTACNNQPQKMVLISSKEALEKLQLCKHQNFGETAAILVCYDKNECWTRRSDGHSSGDVDASIVITYMMLEAHSQGLGSTWIMSFDTEKAKSEFNIPENYVPLSILVLGYPSENAEPNPRHFEKKSIDKSVFNDSF